MVLVERSLESLETRPFPEDVQQDRVARIGTDEIATNCLRCCLGCQRDAARCGAGVCAISAISLPMMALPKELKFSATMTKAPGPPITLVL